jgi:hypothetical protein
MCIIHAYGNISKVSESFDFYVSAFKQLGELFVISTNIRLGHVVSLSEFPL